MPTLFQAVVLATSLVVAPNLTWTEFRAADAQTPAKVRQWTEIRAVEDGFTVQFPGPATATSREVPGETGPIALRGWMVELDSGFTAYLMQSMGLSERRLLDPPETILKDAINGGAERFPGSTRTKEFAIELGGHPGREAVFEGEMNNVATRIHSRVFLIRKRVYMLVAVQMQGHFDQAEVDRFLGSFALIAR